MTRGRSGHVVAKSGGSDVLDDEVTASAEERAAPNGRRSGLLLHARRGRRLRDIPVSNSSRSFVGSPLLIPPWPECPDARAHVVHGNRDSANARSCAWERRNGPGLGGLADGGVGGNGVGRGAAGRQARARLGGRIAVEQRIGGGDRTRRGRACGRGPLPTRRCVRPAGSRLVLRHLRAAGRAAGLARRPPCGRVLHGRCPPADASRGQAWAATRLGRRPPGNCRRRVDSRNCRYHVPESGIRGGKHEWERSRS